MLGLTLDCAQTLVWTADVGNTQPGITAPWLMCDDIVLIEIMKWLRELECQAAAETHWYDAAEGSKRVGAAFETLDLCSDKILGVEPRLE